MTHALLGATVAQLALGRRLGGTAAAIGAAAALLPDVDVLIASPTDPLLAVEHHRGFTHALAFVPLGGAVAALPWMVRARAAGKRLALAGAGVLGYATHGPLDAATTYGTQLFWPFSRMRVGLDVISIIDPLFTLVLLVGLVLALRRASPRPAGVALLLCLLWLGTGALQRARALSAQAELAAARGHEVSRGAVFPGFANNLVWRSLYRAGDSLHTDRIRVPPGGRGSWTPGTSVPLLREADLPGAKRADPRLLRDFRRFAWFSDGWVARAPGDSTLIGDARYSLTTGGYRPVWGVRLRPEEPAEPTVWVNRSRERQLGLGDLWMEISGRDPAYRPLP